MVIGSFLNSILNGLIFFVIRTVRRRSRQWTGHSSLSSNTHTTVRLKGNFPAGVITIWTLQPHKGSSEGVRIPLDAVGRVASNPQRFV